MSDQNYTKPKLRQKIKDKLHKSDKGARPGQWSARKAQMLAAEYKKQGGSYADGQGASAGADNKPANKGTRTTGGAKAGKKASKKVSKKTSNKKTGKKVGKKTGKQKSLDRWTAQEWTTADGKKARGKKTTKRYLPKKAWQALSPAEKKATDDKKVAQSKRGKQTVSNTPSAKKARKKVVRKTGKAITRKKTATKKKAGRKKATGRR